MKAVAVGKKSKRPSRPSCEELQAIRESVDRAMQTLIARYGPEMQHSQATEQFLSRVSSGQRFSFRDATTRQLFTRAIRNDDVMFFSRLGAALGKPSWKHLTIKLPSPLETFLLGHWAQSRDGLPELFYLTPEGLTDVLIHHLGIEDLSTAAVVKIRQRLGLKPFCGEKKRVIRIGNRLKWD